MPERGGNGEHLLTSLTGIIAVTDDETVIIPVMASWRRGPTDLAATAYAS